MPFASCLSSALVGSEGLIALGDAGDADVLVFIRVETGKTIKEPQIPTKCKAHI